MQHLEHVDQGIANEQYDTVHDAPVFQAPEFVSIAPEKLEIDPQLINLMNKDMRKDQDEK